MLRECGKETTRLWEPARRVGDRPASPCHRDFSASAAILYENVQENGFFFPAEFAGARIHLWVVGPWRAAVAIPRAPRTASACKARRKNDALGVGPPGAGVYRQPFPVLCVSGGRELQILNKGTDSLFCVFFCLPSTKYRDGSRFNLLGFLTTYRG